MGSGGCVRESCRYRRRDFQQCLSRAPTKTIEFDFRPLLEMRVERDGPATVHMFGLGVGADGEAVYVARGVALLDDLLEGQVPALGGGPAAVGPQE